MTAPRGTAMDRRAIYDAVDALAPSLQDACRYLWAHPEPGGKEELSAAYMRELVAAHGGVLHDVEGMPYAFWAEWGRGGPTIAILGEHDALPGLSQEACATRAPVVEGGPGHGCGHSLLGPASAVAAIATKEIMERAGLAGTVRFYGCPQEELLSGKVEMIARGAFEGCDLAITWHPMSSTQVWDGGALANVSARFHFTGRSSHAAAAPEKGRSALDAVELMSVGVNYLREHVIDSARIHYATDSGGLPPNIVPPSASSWYYVRAPHMRDVKEILARVEKIAQGAALMTETSVRVEVEGGCCEIRPAHAFAALAHEEMMAAPLPRWTEEELAFARALQESLDPAVVARDEETFGCPGPMMDRAGEIELARRAPLSASSDIGDVSFVMPLQVFASACWPLGVSPHTWQATAACGTSLGEKGALYAAKVMASLACALLTRPDAREAIVAEHLATRDPSYAPMVPAR